VAGKSALNDKGGRALFPIKAAKRCYGKLPAGGLSGWPLGHWSSKRRSRKLGVLVASYQSRKVGVLDSYGKQKSKLY
jgi:hypothetical protein